MVITRHTDTEVSNAVVTTGKYLSSLVLVVFGLLRGVVVIAQSEEKSIIAFFGLIALKAMSFVEKKQPQNK